ncbi:VOC family protein [Erwinia sp. E_sp_B04_7]|uniref:VOC family protein n=1 Tax=unclassified Erwinia TaxID=2622719 RepID=UPI0030D5E75A
MIPPAQTRFGLEHPLVTVKDHARTLQLYIRMGFSPSPVSYHPWGTVTSLMMFRNNFIELIGVDDATKFGTNSVNGFCFGRQLGSFLERGEEGISLVALHSKDADKDYEDLTTAGLAGQGRIDFRRRMTLPDGSPDEAVVSLGLFIDEQQPDISNFICHQHKPELIWVPGWQHHPNGVDAIVAVTWLADPASLVERWKTFYGENVVLKDGVLTAETGYGQLRAMDQETAEKHYPGIPLPERKEPGAHGIAITLNTHKPDDLKLILEHQNIPFSEFSDRILVAPDWTGNVIFEFITGIQEGDQL